eukprot:1639673-Rhodomonas_salina.2
MAAGSAVNDDGFQNETFNDLQVATCSCSPAPAPAPVSAGDSEYALPCSLMHVRRALPDCGASTEMLLREMLLIIEDARADASADEDSAGNEELRAC